DATSKNLLAAECSLKGFCWNQAQLAEHAQEVPVIISLRQLAIHDPDHHRTRDLNRGCGFPRFSSERALREMCSLFLHFTFGSITGLPARRGCSGADEVCFHDADRSVCQIAAVCAISADSQSS